MDVFVAMWIALFCAGIVIEVFALGSKERGRTLSEQVWFLRTKFYGRLVLIPLWTWLSWHFFIEPSAIGPSASYWWDDYLVIATGIIASVVVDYVDHDKPPEIEVDGV